MKGLSKPNEQGKNIKVTWLWVSRLRGIEKNEKAVYRTKIFLSFADSHLQIRAQIEGRE